MIALLQRVTSASVRVGDQTVGEIGTGLLVFVGIKPDDADPDAHRILERLLKYRIFGDVAGKMNLSLQQIGGGLLLVPQFTLAADTRHGLRPGFSTAAPPEHGRRLFDVLLQAARAQHPQVASGQFGANMQVSLVNDGPVTFWLES
ncbi:MAG: D-aminoacyl-tRNA deacylase [Steroidobacteraceae bacterium]|jgi:D-tyrosyl-tRNA(Tyr) deacylase